MAADANAQLRARVGAWMGASGCTDARELGPGAGFRSGAHFEAWLARRRELLPEPLARVRAWLEALERGERAGAVGADLFDPVWPRLELLSNEAARALAGMLDSPGEPAAGSAGRSSTEGRPAKRPRAGAHAGRQLQKGRMLGVVLEEAMRYEAEQLAAKLGGRAQQGAGAPALAPPARAASLAEACARAEAEWRARRSRALVAARPGPAPADAPAAPPALCGWRLDEPPAAYRPVLVPPSERPHAAGKAPSSGKRSLWRCPHAVLHQGHWLCVSRPRTPPADGAAQPGAAGGSGADGRAARRAERARARGGYDFFHLRRTEAEVEEHLRDAEHVPLARPLTLPLAEPAAARTEPAGARAQPGALLCAPVAAGVDAEDEDEDATEIEGESEAEVEAEAEAEAEEYDEEAEPVPAGRTLVRVVKAGRLRGREGLIEGRLPGNLLQVRLGRSGEGGSLVSLRAREMVCVQSGAKRDRSLLLLGKAPPAPATPLVQLARCGRWAPLSIYSPSAAAFLLEMASNPARPPSIRPQRAASHPPACGACDGCLSGSGGRRPCEATQRRQRSHAERRCVAVGCSERATRGVPADPKLRSYFCAAHAPHGTVACYAKAKAKVMAQRAAAANDASAGAGGLLALALSLTPASGGPDAQLNNES